jgi:hypothetical protein
MVIGDDVEGQLAPYNEEIQVDPYRKYGDPGWLFRFYAEKHPGEPEPSLEKLVAYINEAWQDEGSEYGVDEMGLYHVSTYNPDSKWDWYTVGGRWMGYFKLKPEAMDRAAPAELGFPGAFGNEPKNDADVVLRGDVDAEAMRAESGEKAGQRWDRAQKIFKGTPVPEAWRTILERHPGDPDAARQEYGKQKRVRAVREHDEKARKESRWEDALLGFDGDIGSFSVSREEFVQRARDNAICPYAYLVEGEWFAPGEMGWWGQSTDDTDDQARFARAFNEMFDALPEDTVLTLVDCHI